jgi:hypothetical protein
MRKRERLRHADPHYPYSWPTRASVLGKRAGNEILVGRINIE